MAKVEIGDTAPDFELPGAEGRMYLLSDYEGMTVLVEIDRWHTWGNPASEA